VIAFISRTSNLLRRVRWADVLILQGAPVFGIAFSSTNLFVPGKFQLLASFLAASLLLVIHVFSFNDWADSLPDGSKQLLWLSVVSLLISLSIFAAVSIRLFWFGTAIAAVGILYSCPGPNGKSRPIVSTMLHLVGGVLYFLLGYSLFDTVGLHGVLVGIFFGLMFAAGHPVQEVRDFDHDRALGVTTNAVVFGVRAAFFAGLILFAIQYAFLFAIAWANLIPRLLMPLPVIFLPLHLWWSTRVIRNGFTRESVIEFQNRYRLLYVVIGILMLVCCYGI
jgi:4-hydroxybenzoate polyprenyltransferase